MNRNIDNKEKKENSNISNSMQLNVTKFAAPKNSTREFNAGEQSIYRPMSQNISPIVDQSSESIKKPVPTTSKIIKPNYYSLQYKLSGLAVMLNNYKFTNALLNFPYKVANKDIESFETLKKYNFQMHNVFLNLTKSRIKQLIRFYTNFDYSDYACFFFCMSSHGGKHTIMSSDCFKMDITDDIVEPFYHVDSLLNKPKIFLFDCCRGNEQYQKDDSQIDSFENSAI